MSHLWNNKSTIYPIHNASAIVSIFIFKLSSLMDRIIKPIYIPNTLSSISMRSLMYVCIKKKLFISKNFPEIQSTNRCIYVQSVERWNPTF